MNFKKIIKNRALSQKVVVNEAGSEEPGWNPNETPTPENPKVEPAPEQTKESPFDNFEPNKPEYKKYAGPNIVTGLAELEKSFAEKTVKFLNVTMVYRNEAMTGYLKDVEVKFNDQKGTIDIIKKGLEDIKILKNEIKTLLEVKTDAKGDYTIIRFLLDNNLSITLNYGKK